MGIYIKGMEMPSKCSECKFFAWKQGVGNHCAIDETITFHATLDGFDVRYEKNGNCPLIPTDDVVPVGAYNQVAWERDMAIEQLKQIGKSFGEQMDDVRSVVHGKWIEREDMCYGWNIWECSACHEDFCVEEGTPKDNEYHFCPNCGADMREES